MPLTDICTPLWVYFGRPK